MRKNKFFVVLINILIICTMMITLVGCGSSASEKSKVTKPAKELLIGKWTSADDSSSGTIEFKKDGTIVSTTASGDAQTANYETKDVKDDKAKVDITIKGTTDTAEFTDDNKMTLRGTDLKRVK